MKPIALLCLPALLLSSCANTQYTNQRHVGPAVGNAIGTGVGVVGGNVAGAAVGLGEGLAKGAAAPFNTDRRIIRTYRTEKTADGREIQVPVEIEVDAQGRPIQQPPTQ